MVIPKGITNKNYQNLIIQHKPIAYLLISFCFEESDIFPAVKIVFVTYSGDTEIFIVLNSGQACLRIDLFYVSIFPYLFHDDNNCLLKQ